MPSADIETEVDCGCLEPRVLIQVVVCRKQCVQWLGGPWNRGAAGLTIGQRRGVGVSSSGRIYVCSKCMADNTVTVGPEEALYSTGCIAKDWNWLTPPPTEAFGALAKTRYRQTEQPVTVVPEGDRVRLEFVRPQRAVTPGQAAVVYHESGAVLGGGTIAEAVKGP